MCVQNLHFKVRQRPITVTFERMFTGFSIFFSRSHSLLQSSVHSLRLNSFQAPTKPLSLFLWLIMWNQQILHGLSLVCRFMCGGEHIANMFSPEEVHILTGIHICASFPPVAVERVAFAFIQKPSLSFSLSLPLSRLNREHLKKSQLIIYKEN